MDFVLNDDQTATLGAADGLLRRHGGPQQARSMLDRHDDSLLKAMRDNGFLGLALDADAGPLDAALIVEAASQRLAAAHVGAAGLVAPLVTGAVPPGRVALAVAGQHAPVRFGADADLVLVLDGPDVRCVKLDPDRVDRVETGYILPYGKPPIDGGDVLTGAGPLLLRWWRVALAAELSGLLSAALEFTVTYLSQRKQFGSPLATLQAVQHRLADCYVWTEGTRWSSRTAAYHGDDESASTAATYATMAARHVVAELHQLTGAIGFTREYDLHLWTMRAQALRVELGGIGVHARDVVAARWLDHSDRDSASRTASSAPVSARTPAMH